MKIKKKTAMLVSFTMGTLLLATTALADIASKSGYEEFKSALKVTAEKSSETFDNFTLDLTMAMKDNGKTITSANETKKFDRINGTSDSISSGLNLNGEKYSSQFYTDKMTMIRVSDNDPTYYVTEFTKERKVDSFENPFKEEQADDFEKIVDAVVGSLKDHVVVTEKPDGSKGLEGKLSEVQIPSLVNAIASFQLKQEFNNNQNMLPHLTKDVFVKKVEGTAQVNPDGVMESIFGSAVISGMDEQGLEHEISLEVLVKISNINSTKILKPDLTGKNVVRNIDRDYTDSEISNPEKFVGKFKNNILIEKEGKFVKVGERYLEIAHVDSQSIAGRYYEEYKPGFEKYASGMNNFKFDAQFEKDQRGNANFDGTSESGSKVKGNIFLSDYEGKIIFGLHNVNLPEGGLMFDSSFSPDVD